MNRTIHQLDELGELKDLDEFAVYDTDSGYTKRYSADGLNIPVGVILPYWGITEPSSHWFICNGTDTTGTDRELAIVYPKLYEALGNSNVLPDLQECVMVGIGHNRTNIFNSSETNPATQQAGTQVHDEYQLGQFKDDQLQGHWHGNGKSSFGSSGNSAGNGYLNIKNCTIGSQLDNIEKNTSTDGYSGEPRVGSVTHGRQIGLNFIIRAD